MAQYDGSIRINTQINTRGIYRGLSDINRAIPGISRSVSGINASFSRLTSTVKRVGIAVAAAFSVKALVRFGQEATRLGSALQEVENIVAVAFPHMTKEMDKFAASATKNFGLSETMAKRYASLFGTMAKQFNFTEKEAFEMGTTLAGLAGDVASFYDIDQDLAYIKLKSVFSGETETLKDIGVVMTEAALNQFALSKGIDRTVSKMSEQEKVALRYQFVLERLSQASGDFIRTSDSWANQTRVLKLQFDSLKATLGQGLINVFTPVIKLINTLLSKLMTLAESFKAFTELITGRKATASKGAGLAGLGTETAADGYNDAAEGAQNLADATGKVTKETKKAEKAAEGYLSPLDEINKIGERNEELADKDSAGDSLGDIIGSAADYGKLADADVDTPISRFFDKMRKAFLDKDWEGLGRLVAKRINKGLKKIYDALDWAKIGPKITSFVNAFTRTLNSLVDNIDWDLMGRVVGRGINDIVKTVNLLIDPDKGIDFVNIGRKLSQGFRGLVNEINWEELGNMFGNWFMISWNVFKGFVDDMWRTSGLTGLNGWQELGRSLADGIAGLFEKIDFGQIGTSVAKGFNGIFETLKEFVLTMERNGTWDDIAHNIYTGLNNMIHKIDWAENGKILSDFVVDLLDTIWKVAENTDWEGFGRGIGDFLSNIDWDGIFGRVFAIITEVVGGLIKGFGDTTAGKFVLAFGAVKLAIKGVKLAGTIKGVLDKLSVIGRRLVTLGDTAVDVGARVAGTRFNWDVLRKAILKVSAAMLGFQIGMKITEVTTSANDNMSEASTYLSELASTLVQLAEQDKITSDQQIELNNTIAELAEKGASNVDVITTLRDALLKAGVSSSDLSTAAQNAGTDLHYLIGVMKDSESGGEAAKSNLDKVGGAAKTAGTDFESLAGKAQGTTSILNDLDITPAKNNIGSIQQAVDGVDFDKLSRNSETAIKNMNAVWNINKTPIRDTIKDVLIDNIKFDDILKEKYSGYAAFSVKGYNDKIKELKGEARTTMQSFAQGGVMDPFANKLGIHSPSTVFAGYGSNIVSGLKNGIGGEWSGFSSWWDIKRESLPGSFNGISDSFKRIGQSMISGMSSGVSDKWSELSSSLEGLKSNVANIFSGIRGDMRSIGENIINGIIDGLQSLWNNLTGWVSGIKDMLTFNISSPFGGASSYSVNTPAPYMLGPVLADIPIPHLAQGTVVPPNREFMAVLGDNKREPEVVSPLSTIEQAVINGMNKAGGNSEKPVNITIQLTVDKKVLGQATVDWATIQRMATGKNPYELRTT